MRTRVFLIRHGATELATEDRFAGTTDVSLSAVGHEGLVFTFTFWLDGSSVCEHVTGR